MKRLAILMVFLFMACASIPTVQTVNASDELKKIVLSDTTTKVAGDTMTLTLGGQLEQGTFVSSITVVGSSVMLECMFIFHGGYIASYMLDRDGDGKIDVWGEMVNGVVNEPLQSDYQKYYDSYLAFARYASDRGEVEGRESGQRGIR